MLLFNSINMKVKLKPISKRAKDRINQHGETFDLINEGFNIILVKSLNNTWKNEKWMGWFDLSKDVQIIVPNCPKCGRNDRMIRQNEEWVCHATHKLDN